MEAYTRRYEGVRWEVAFGTYENEEKFATIELQRICQHYLPYVLKVAPAQAELSHYKEHLIMVGTPESNPLIRQLVDQQIIDIPNQKEAYHISCFSPAWNPQQRVLCIAGSDPKGVLNGVVDFATLLQGDYIRPERSVEYQEAFDGIPDFSITDYPRIQQRGIWTWGYVIYDYLRFLENMARLKMNTLIIWNDCPPINITAILDKAHELGIRVILGYHWGWGLQINPTDEADLEKVKHHVIHEYEKAYAHLDHDGIYFQTFTEVNDLTAGGETMAKHACNWVNSISKALLEKHPDLTIQFGIHASSIMEHYMDLNTLDPRVMLVWEDAGVLPYTYDPVPSSVGTSINLSDLVNSVDKTIAYSKSLIHFRKRGDFAMVAKGWTCLRWGVEFEHHESFILGERDPEYIRKRFEERLPRWNYVNQAWFKHYPIAQQFYQELLSDHPTSMLVTLLVEDGMFEYTIQPSVTLFAQLLWNPSISADQLMKMALSPYYSTC
jgi:hypothetical protein